MFEAQNVYKPESNPLPHAFVDKQQRAPEQQQQQPTTQTQDDDAAVKFTCRFDIQIDNDKEFQVARRLIGAKGCNMKRILEVCSKNAP